MMTASGPYTVAVEGRSRLISLELLAAALSSFASGVMKLAMRLLFTSTTGASPQAPKHSPSFSVKLPSAVVSLKPMPSCFFRCSAASFAPCSAHGRLVQIATL